MKILLNVHEDWKKINFSSICITQKQNIVIGKIFSIGRLSAIHANGIGLRRIGDNFVMNSNSQLGASEFGKL